MWGDELIDPEYGATVQAGMQPRSGAGEASLPMGLVIHANARRVRRRYLPFDRFWLRLLPRESTFVVSTIADLDAAMVALRARHVRVIACLGGDGSLHHLVEAMLRHFGSDESPVFLPLAGGTLNGLAHAFGTAGRPGNVIKTALQELSFGRLSAKHVPILELRDASSSLLRYGFTFAAGLPTRAVAQYNGKAAPGVLAAAQVSVSVLGGSLFGGRFHAPVDLHVAVDAEPMPPMPHTVVAGVVERPFLWFTPFGPEVPNAGAFRLVVVSMRRRDMALRLWQIFRGRCRHPAVRMGAALNATVRGSGGYVLDGEIYAADSTFEVDISAGSMIRVLDLRRARDAGHMRREGQPAG